MNRTNEGEVPRKTRNPGKTKKKSREEGLPLELLHKTLLELQRMGELEAWEKALIYDLLEFLPPGARGDYGLLILFLVFTTHEGSLCLSLRSLKSDSKIEGSFFFRMIQLLPEQAQERIDHLRILLENPSPILTFQENRDSGVSTPLIFRKDEECLYFQKYHSAKTGLEKRLGNLFRFPSSPAGNLNLEEILNTILKEEPIRIEREGEWIPIPFTDSQKAAIYLGLQNRFLLITGGPGTGKTSTIVQILRGLLRSGVQAESIHLCAPTGRAARRMTESIRKSLQGISGETGSVRGKELDTTLLQLEASTIHRLLRYNPIQHAFHFNEENPLPSGIFLVDEVSMVDILLMNRLLEAIDPGTSRVFFLGDPDQLPSVEAGSVLTDLKRLILGERGVPSYTADFQQVIRRLAPGFPFPAGEVAVAGTEDRIVLLDRGHRSSDSITEFSNSILNGSLKDSFLDTLRKREWKDEEGVLFLEETYRAPRQVLEDLVNLWIGSLFPPEYNSLLDTLRAGNAKDESASQLFRILEKGRILTARRVGPRGSILLNRIALSYYQNRTGTRYDNAFDVFSDAPFPDGTPLLITRNDPVREVFNGDTGILLHGENGTSRVLLEKPGGGHRFLDLESLPPHECAFAMTIHKSQGSEYDRVLLILPGDEYPGLTAEILYAWATRARRSITLFGKREILKNISARRIRRETGSFHPMD